MQAGWQLLQWHFIMTCQYDLLERNALIIYLIYVAGQLGESEDGDGMNAVWYPCVSANKWSMSDILDKSCSIWGVAKLFGSQPFHYSLSANVQHPYLPFLHRKVIYRATHNFSLWILLAPKCHGIVQTRVLGLLKQMSIPNGLLLQEESWQSGWFVSCRTFRRKSRHCHRDNICRGIHYIWKFREYLSIEAWR